MADTRDTWVLAADGGGTQCRVALDTGPRRHVATLGPANVTTDPDGAASTLREGLSRVAAQAGCDPETLPRLSCYLALAGLLEEAQADALRAALGLPGAVIEDERRAAIRGALGPADGALAALGTGSFFAVQRDGAVRAAGGWGARLGDEASGHWIARAALTATLDTVDGLRPATSLTEALLAFFGDRPAGIVAFAADATPTEIAALAPKVTAAAEAGDAVASEILDAAAAHVEATLAALGWRAGAPICLIGGAADSVAEHLSAPARAGRVAPRGSVLDGAVGLARARCARGGVVS